MAEKQQEVAQTAPAAPPAQNSEERNFANLRKIVEEERKEKQQLLERLSKLEAESKKKPQPVEEDDYDEPYVNPSKLKKELSSVYERAKEDAKKEAYVDFKKAMEEEKQHAWLKQNPDFYDIMQHAQTFAEKDPELAESILSMPDTFERQKLVYKNIKALGVHKPAQKETIQSKVDNNRKGVYYSPPDYPTPSGAAAGDFSEAGQKAAYDKLLKLKQGLRAM